MRRGLARMVEEAAEEMRACMRACMHACMHAYVCPCGGRDPGFVTHAQTHTCMYDARVDGHVYIRAPCTNARMLAPALAHMYTDACFRSATNICTHEHTHKHTHAHMHRCGAAGNGSGCDVGDLIGGGGGD